jgi:hypothetical protein
VIRESVQVHTNDPAHGVIELAVSGKVEVFADIRPKSLRLAGQLGHPVTLTAEIIPRADQPFKIKNARAMNGQYLQFNLADKVKEGQKVYELTVTNTRREPGRFSDVIYLETDSPIRPMLQVPIYGIIVKPQ